MDPVSTTPSLSDVQDILYYIFPHLDPDRSSWTDASHARQTLLSSALTCRNFTQPALNTLWRSLPKDEPLISLLCLLGIAQDSGLLSREPDSPYGSSTLKDPRMHPKWNQFREYATRVREIILDSYSNNPVKRKLSFWTEVSRLLHDEPILPLLQSVTITVYTAHILCDIPLPLISPSVRRMDIRLKADRDDSGKLEHILTEACARAPHLETITLMIVPWSINLSVLHGNLHLRSIAIYTALPVEDLVPLAYLAKLEDLSVVLAITAQDFSPTTLNIPSLRLLSVKGPWIPICNLLKCMEAPHNRSLTLHVTHDDPWQFIDKSHACLQTTATKFPALETLSVNCERSSHALRWALSGVIDTEGTLMAVFEPLLSLRLLRHLTLDFRPYILRHTSDDLRRFAEAWPDVEELVVNVATVDGGRAGFECIAHFARHCPRLRALRLPAMDLAVDTFDGLEYPAEPHPLRDLDVAEVVFPREEDLSHEMTAFIQRVFPNAAVPFSQHPIVVTDEESGDRSRVV